jgi:hypothetical protein
MTALCQQDLIISKTRKIKKADNPIRPIYPINQLIISSGRHQIFPGDCFRSASKF